MMKRTLSVLALVLIFCLTAACGAEEVLSQMTGGQSETDASQQAEPPQNETDTDAEAAPILPGSDEASGTDALPQDTDEPQTGLSGSELAEGDTDASSLPAEQCVGDALPDPNVLPRITLDCPGAAEINQAIQDQFFSVAEDPLWDLHYEYAKGAGHILSIAMLKQANDWTEYTVFNLDLATGEALAPSELLALLNVDTDELANLEQAVMGDEFIHEFGTAETQTDPAFYEQQYERTTSADNVELEKLWFSGDGQLCFVGRIYPLAGAEYYEHQLPTGWTF